MIKTKDQFETVMKEIRGISEDIARLDRDITVDRQDMADFKVRLGSLEVEIRELRRITDTHNRKVEERVTDAVHEVTEPVRREAKSLKEMIKDKKMIILKSTRKWWEVWKI